MKWIVKGLLIGFIILANGAAFASDFFNNITRYDNTNGLPQNSVRRITKDANGFFWIQTESGFARWNGDKMKQIRLTADGMPVPNDLTGELWFGAHAAFFRNDPGGHEFFFINAKSQVQALRIRNGFIAPPRSSGDLLPVPEDTASFYRNNDPATAREFLHCLFGGQGRVCLRIDAGSWIVLRGRQVFLVAGTRIRRMPDLRTTIRTAVRFGHHLILSGDESPAYAYDLREAGNGTYKPISCGHNNQAQLWHLQGGADALYLGCGNRVHRLTEKGTRFQVEDLAEISEGLQPGCFYYDEGQKLLLLGTKYSGLLVYSRSLFRIAPLSKRPVDNVFYSMDTLPGGRIVTNQQLFRLLRAKPTDEWDWGMIGAIRHVPGTGLLTSTPEHLVLLDPELRTKWKVPLRERVIRSFLITDTTIYFLNNRIGRIHADGSHLEERLFSWPEQDVVVDAFCRSPFPNKLYAVSNGRLYLIDPNTRQLQLLTNEKLNGVRSMTFDAGLNTVLISTKGTGTWAWVGNSHLRRLPPDGDQFLNYAHYTFIDREGDLWFPTNNGLFVLERRSLRDWLLGYQNNLPFRHFRVNEGGAPNEFNGGFEQACIVRGDSIIFATMQGLAACHLGIKKSGLARPEARLVIDRLTADNEPLAPEADLALPSDFGTIQLEADYPVGGGPHSALQYRLLSKQDSGWQNMDGNLITLENLRSGNYRLQIRTDINGEHLLFDRALEVAPRWYRTIWGLILLLVALAVLTHLYGAWRASLAKARGAILLNQSREEYFTIIAHDLRSPIYSYLNLMSSISYLLRRQEFDRLERISMQLEEKGHRFRLLLDNLLNWGLSQQKRLSNRPEPIDLGPLLEDLVSVYKAIASGKKQEIVTRAEGPCDVFIDANLLTTIIRNLLDNATKHTPAGQKIEAAYRNTGDLLILSTKNPFLEHQTQAIAMAAGYLNEPGQKNFLDRNIGLGLQLIVECVGLLSGWLQATMTDTEISIEVMIPLKNDPRQKTDEHVQAAVC